VGTEHRAVDEAREREARLWYARQTVEHGWSRKVLEAQIASDLRGRQGHALTSFGRALPAPDSELVRDVIKDPYNFEFLSLSADAKERDLELALLHDVQSFLMEMGRGFALVGRQFPLRVPDADTGVDQEFFIDLLFYNYLLRRFVVIDLKIEDFKPEFAGKMNFYLMLSTNSSANQRMHPPSASSCVRAAARRSRNGRSAGLTLRSRWRATSLARSS
jgi:predicted nuclease of restriction endonuclease-like (RecB) superfamily